MLREQLPEHAARWFRADDYVLVKSSGGTRLSELVESLTNTEPALATP